MSESAARPRVFLDFDGTITNRDAIDAMLEAFADERWLALEEEWRAGRIGSRACLRGQMALVEATPAQLSALLDTIEVDEGFALLLDTCAAHGAAVHIISDGFDYCIRHILSRPSLNLAARLAGVRICSSHLERAGRRWRTSFPYFARECAHGCATCKPAVMRLLNPASAPAVFVGDGLSDQYAALGADLVYAKGRLAALCTARRIEHTTYEGLASVAASLDEILRAGRLAPTTDVVAAHADA